MSKTAYFRRKAEFLINALIHTAFRAGSLPSKIILTRVQLRNVLTLKSSNILIDNLDTSSLRLLHALVSTQESARHFRVKSVVTMNLYLLEFVAVVLILRLPQKTGADLLNKHCILLGNLKIQSNKTFISVRVRGCKASLLCMHASNALKSYALFSLFHDSHFLSLLSYAI